MIATYEIGLEAAKLVRTRRPSVEEHIELPRHATGKARDPGCQ